VACTSKVKSAVNIYCIIIVGRYLSLKVLKAIIEIFSVKGKLGRALEFDDRVNIIDSFKKRLDNFDGKCTCPQQIRSTVRK